DALYKMLTLYKMLVNAVKSMKFASLSWPLRKLP
ncbi:MAG: hypothetical protein ACI9R3_006252, partial [Verrucomicrobiales bacterium]